MAGETGTLLHAADRNGDRDDRIGRREQSGEARSRETGAGGECSGERGERNDVSLIGRV
jgi:hypothetical protein